METVPQSTLQERERSPRGSVSAKKENQRILRLCFLAGVLFI